MKQVVLTVGMALIAFGGFSQKKNVVNAVLAYKNHGKDKASQDIESAAAAIIEAKEFIDLADVHEDTKGQAKTLAYKGMIYLDYAMFTAIAPENPTFKDADVEKIAEDGMAALKKVKDVDKKGLYEDKVGNYANAYRSQLSEFGRVAYSDKKYEDAMAGLLGAAEFGDIIGITDSSFYYYGGAAAFNAEKWEEAQAAFEKCVEIDYNAGSSAYYVSQSLQKQGKVDEAEASLKAMMVKYPDNKDIMIEMINLYIDTDRKEEAEKVLTSAIALDPNNTTLIYTSGTIYENLGRFEDAEAAYKKTIEIDASNTNAQFALGGLYFNKGADVNNEANKLPFGDANYDPMIAESKEYFQKALPFLEQAAVLEKDDVVILESLKAVYGKLQMTDKFLETKKRIAEIKG